MSIFGRKEHKFSNQCHQRTFIAKEDGPYVLSLPQDAVMCNALEFMTSYDIKVPRSEYDSWYGSELTPGQVAELGKINTHLGSFSDHGALMLDLSVFCLSSGR